ncbi:MAG: type II toxin-antitoxin system HicB family antitoxin [Verrucomicrobiia bacterium]|jgi:predicted RNase H-like HicB family nuclease
MKSRRYKVIIEPDEPKGFHVWVPALRGCHSFGTTVDEAKRNIREAIDLYLESLEARGLPIPRESTRVAEVQVEVA